MNAVNSKPLAVITGAGHRLGRLFATALAQRGYAILLHYFSSEIMAFELINELKSQGYQIYPVKADLTDLEQIMELWKEIDLIHLPLEVLINSAAIMPKGNIKYLSPQEFDHVYSLNLRAPLICSQEAVKRMEKGGLIINISDVGAGKNWLHYPAYTISKSSLEVLTRIFAKAVAPGIQVNAIAPGIIFPPEGMDPLELERLLMKVPSKRTVSPDEIISIVDLLLNNKYITGQIITVDGGYSL